MGWNAGRQLTILLGNYWHEKHVLPVKEKWKLLLSGKGHWGTATYCTTATMWHSEGGPLWRQQYGGRDDVAEHLTLIDAGQHPVTRCVNHRTPVARRELSLASCGLQRWCHCEIIDWNKQARMPLWWTRRHMGTLYFPLSVWGESKTLWSGKWAQEQYEKIQSNPIWRSGNRLEFDLSIKKKRSKRKRKKRRRKKMRKRGRDGKREGKKEGGQTFTAVVLTFLMLPPLTQPLILWWPQP